MYYLIIPCLKQTKNIKGRRKQGKKEERRGKEKGEEIKRREEKKGIKLRKVSKISTGQ